MKEGLASEDLERALRFVGRVQDAADLDSYRREVLGILDLIEGNISSYNEIELASGRVFALTEPPIDDDQIEIFAHYKDQNPLLTYHFEHEDPGPVALSDLISAERFHATDVYKYFYSLFGIEDQIAMGLPAPPGQVIAVVVNRSWRGFSDRERALLELVRPHAIQSFRMAQEAERSRRQIAALSARLERVGEPPSLDQLVAEHGLTPRQRAVLALLAEGASTEAIAAQLVISPATVLKHIENIRSALGVHSRVELLARVYGAD